MLINPRLFEYPKSLFSLLSLLQMESTMLETGVRERSLLPVPFYDYNAMHNV
jgi:hypothetical protein